jgi:hypothetical protein
MITDDPCLFVDIIGGGGAKFMETRCAMASKEEKREMI